MESADPGEGSRPTPPLTPPSHGLGVFISVGDLFGRSRVLESRSCDWVSGAVSPLSHISLMISSFPLEQSREWARAGSLLCMSSLRTLSLYFRGAQCQEGQQSRSFLCIPFLLDLGTRVHGPPDKPSFFLSVTLNLETAENGRGHCLLSCSPLPSCHSVTVMQKVYRE